MTEANPSPVPVAADGQDYKAVYDAIGRSQAVIEFKMDGTIANANKLFLDAMGYVLNEVKGKNHSMFVDPAYKNSAEYREFWAKLNRGEFQTGEFKRIGKGGKEVWIQASYNPIMDGSGRPVKVIKFATDVTKAKMKAADTASQIAAIDKSQGMIEFNMDGTVITANENFLKVMGYTLAEIQGKHHSMFVEPSCRDTPEYREFWAKLNRGEFQASEYKRIGKGGKEVWIQASYNPIRDLNGKIYKIVKFATDVTETVSSKLDARNTIGNVAAGVEQLNASIKGISDSMSKSSLAANTAAEQVGTADQATQRLSSAAQAMVGIVEVINDIASQINLLALNATIESARAGEAGKGFAVVANEVKNLANQAKNATEHISKEIDGMRGISDEVVGALSVIKKSIEDVREYVTSTAAAVEEQSAATHEISSSTQKAQNAISNVVKCG